MNFPHSTRATLGLLIGLLIASALRAQPVISEFMAANATTLFDEDRQTSDWIEIFNPDAAPVSLAGWYLTDSAKKKNKWQFPAIEVPARGYLVVFASGKDRRDPARPLHTNFSLDADGEYLALVRPDGDTVATEFAPTFPPQRNDVSYGTGGFFTKPTPGAANAPLSLTQSVVFSRDSGLFSENFTLELRGAAAGQQIRYVLSPSSTLGGKIPLPTSSSPEYRSPLAITASSVVSAAIFSADGSASGPSTTAHFIKVNGSATSFSSQLPVLVLDDLGAGALVKDDVDHPSWLYAFPARANGAPTFTAAPTLATPLTVSVRGASSADFPKKSYNVKFRDAQGAGQAQPLLGMPAAERWALVAPWNYDPTYINNAFMYELSNRIGRWAARTRLAEVFFKSNGGDLDAKDYAGIYVVTERIEPDEQRVAIAKLDDGDSITGGYIFKIDSPATGDVSWRTEHWPADYRESSAVLVAPEADEVTAAQRDYLRNYVQQMENALLADQATGWSQRSHLDTIDLNAWIDHHLLNTFACNPDAFYRSAYFTKDRGGKLMAGPAWDFDRALGSEADLRSFRYDVWQGVGGVDFWRIGWWGLLARDSEFMQGWIDRWQTLRGAEFSDAALVAIIDGLAGQVGNDAAARDAARWPENKSPYGSYSAQIEHMRGWVTLRARWIDQQFVAAPARLEDKGTITFSTPAGSQLYYTLDGSDPRSLGGEIAPNALVSSAPLTVPATANVHVRAYRADMKDVFPGSPWSVAVSGGSSSPLAPRSRVVNLSSRASIGTGENALFAGVAVADTAGKRFLARGIGPALTAFGATGVIPDPRLGLFDQKGREIAHNQRWETSADPADLARSAAAVGAFPLAPGSADSAMTSELPAGTFSLQVTTAATQPGVGLVELYELDAIGRAVNLSARARVRRDGALVGGFVIQGRAYVRLLVRGVGPTLTTFGVTDALTDPVLTLYSGQTVVATNARWSTQENAAAIVKATTAVGAFALPVGRDDAALLITLAPGAYTVEVKARASDGGVALVEIYDVP